MNRYPKPVLLILAAIAILACTALSLPGCKQNGGDATADKAPAATDIAQTTVMHFNVAGMHCQGCVNAITTAVANLEGVTACDVSLEEESATVTVTDPALAETIIQAINDLNYTAELADA